MIEFVWNYNLSIKTTVLPVLEKMTRESAKEDETLMLCRLMNFIGGQRLYAREFDTPDLPLNHVFYNKILSGIISNPIILNMEKQQVILHEPDFRIAKDVLKKATTELQEGGEWGDSISRASSAMKQFVFVARYLCQHIRSRAINLAEADGIKDVVLEKHNLLALCMEKPCKAINPFHLHVSDNEVGGSGGDIAHIIQRLEIIEGSDADYLSPPVSWWIDSSLDMPICLHHFSGLFTNKKNCMDRMEYVYSISLDTVHMLGALADEINDIHSELVNWMILPCIMALHSRLGQTSKIGMVGVDALIMIMNFL